jgi:(p)ppGpp synthase/HD superfamily hydrolase
MNAKEFVNQLNIQRRMKMSPLELEAAMFAFECHKGMTRKFNFEPYVCHTAEVASIASQVTNDSEALAAAHLHDVVEDCGIDLGLIETKFGKNIAKYVSDLTNPSQLDPELMKKNRVERKQADRLHMINAAAQSKTVKLADILSNINSLVYNDPSFARVWIKEKEALMPYLEGGDVKLYSLVHASILGAKSFLGI